MHITRRGRRARRAVIRTLGYALALALASGRLPAVAGPPYVTDDPEPATYRSFEFYLAPQFVRSGASASGSAPTVDINYGLLREVHVTAALPLAFSRSEPGPTAIGVGDAQLGVKYRFVRETPRLPQIAFYPSVSISTGASTTGLGSGAVQTFLPLWAQKSFGPSTVFGGGGLHLDPSVGHRTWWYAGAVVTRALSRDLSVGAELYRTTPVTWDGRGTTGASLGVTRAFGELHTLLFSLGRSYGDGVGFSAYAAYEIRKLSRARPSEAR
ncbi:MAG: hypothetical protein NVSMB21_18630 [Vulcanimicrobiaceae bacterium]